MFARVLRLGAIHMPSAPISHSLAEVFGILPLRLSSLTPRPKGYWGTGLVEEPSSFGGLNLRKKEGGGPPPNLQNCISSYFSGFPQLLKGSKSNSLSKIKVQYRWGIALPHGLPTPQPFSHILVDNFFQG